MNTRDEAALRRYLLGKASPAEQEDFELWLMSDNDASDLIEAAEDDLIDDALAGRLSQADVDLFESHFMSAPERQRKYQFGLSFKRVIASASTRSEPLSASGPPSILERILQLFRLRPVLAIAFALIALVIGVGLSSLRVINLRRDLRSTQAQLASTNRDRNDLKRQLDDSQAEVQTLANRLRGLADSMAASNFPATNAVAALTLLPGITRSTNVLPELKLTPNTALARFSLALADSSFSSFRVTLASADGREIWSEDRISSSTGPDGRVVVSFVPAQLLTNGEYTFSLAGLPPAGAAETLGRYVFKVSR